MSDDPPKVTLLRDEPHAVIAVDEIDVIEWCPGEDGLHPEQVHILFRLPELEVTFQIRLKSRRAVDTLVAALNKHAKGVWG